MAGAAPVVLLVIDEVADVRPLPLHKLPVPVCDARFGLPPIGNAVVVPVTLLKLSIVEQLRPKAVLNRVVFVLDEMSKEERRDVPVTCWASIAMAARPTCAAIAFGAARCIPTSSSVVRRNPESLPAFSRLQL